MNSSGDARKAELKDIADRARAIRERLDRIGARRAGEPTNDRLHRRIVVGDDEDTADTHTAHLAPRP